MSCLAEISFVMKATVLRGATGGEVSTTPENGYYNRIQDPDTGELSYVWVEGTDTSEHTNPLQYDIKCAATPFIDSGYRSSANTEVFQGDYKVMEYVKVNFPARYNVTRRDLVTNIRNKKGIVLWAEEEDPDSPATVFEVLGISPLPDFYGNHAENVMVLKRAAQQVGI